jgi:hypothetical protein
MVELGSHLIPKYQNGSLNEKMIRSFFEKEKKLILFQGASRREPTIG